MAFLSRRTEIDPLLPLDGELRVEAGGAPFGWLSTALFLPLTCWLLISFTEELRRHYLVHDLHFNFRMAVAPMFCIGFALIAYMGIQRARAAHLPVVLLRPGELRLCNSLAPIALKDIQDIEYQFFRDSAVITLVIKPQASLPLLSPHQFGMPYGRRVWRKHRVFLQLFQPMYAGKLVTKSSVIRRLQQYWTAANVQGDR